MEHNEIDCTKAGDECKSYGKLDCSKACEWYQAEREGDGHDSDCATHDAPAYPKGECDCSAQDDVTQYNPWRAHIYAVMEGDSYFGAQDWNDLLAYMDGEHKKSINLDDQVKQLSSMVRQYETALRIKNEEHCCCAEDLLEARKDTERLEWLMHHVSGAEFRRLGVTYGGNCGRDRIDAAMKVGAGDTAADDEDPEWQNAVQAAFGGIVQTPQG